MLEGVDLHVYTHGYGAAAEKQNTPVTAACLYYSIQ